MVRPRTETIDASFDKTKIAEDELRRIAKDSVEKLGYRIQDECSRLLTGSLRYGMLTAFLPFRLPPDHHDIIRRSLTCKD